MREGYKMTELGEIPKEWEIARIGDYVDSFAGGTPLRSKSEFYQNGTIPWVKSGEVNQRNIFGTEEKITEKAIAESAAKLIRENSVLVALYGATAGNVGMLRVKAASNQAVLALYSKVKDLSNEYVYYYLKQTTTKLLSLTQGSGQPNLSKGIIDSLKIALPPINEQEKIAEILNNVDEKIEVIEEQINQTTELKKGLMQRLLTKGIGHTQFKDSQLGEIPESWEVDLLDNVAKRGSGHTPNKDYPEYYNGEIKWISLSDSDKLDNRWISETKTRISKKGIENSSAVLHPKGTVLMSRDAGIGKSAIMSEQMAVSQHFITWTCSEHLNNWFLYYFLQLNKPMFERIAIGSTIKTIGLPFFKKLKIPVPSIDEQKIIADILYTVDDKLEILQTKKGQCQELKKGLMQQLLTGKLRVNHLIENPVPA